MKRLLSLLTLAAVALPASAQFRQVQTIPGTTIVPGARVIQPSFPLSPLTQPGTVFGGNQVVGGSVLPQFSQFNPNLNFAQPGVVQSVVNGQFQPQFFQNPQQFQPQFFQNGTLAPNRGFAFNDGTVLLNQAQNPLVNRSFYAPNSPNFNQFNRGGSLIGGQNNLIPGLNQGRPNTLGNTLRNLIR